MNEDLVNINENEIKIKKEISSLRNVRFSRSFRNKSVYASEIMAVT